MSHYIYDDRDLHLAFEGHYNLGLVLLSMAIIILASYAALSVANRIRSTDSAIKQGIWLLAGSGTLGGGVWAMHFIGMLAYELPIPVSYDFLITMISIFPACLGAYFMLLLISRQKMGKFFFSTIFLLLGLISTMHFIGMLAMQGVSRQIIMMFEPKLLTISCILSTFGSMTAITVNFLIGRSKEMHNASWAIVSSAVLIGLGFGITHYGAMWATYFFPGDKAMELNESSLNNKALVLWVSSSSVFVTFLAIFIAVVDRRIENATRGEQISHTRMHEAIESITDGFCLFDMDDRLAECNQRYREIMDIGVPLTIGMNFDAIVRYASTCGLILDAVGREAEWLEQRIERHRMPRDNFVEHFCGERWIQVSERRVWNIGTVAICSDITELKQIEIELNKAIAKTEEANNAKSAFLAQMSHELRTPMNAIMGYSEMLLEDMHETNSDAASDLSKIHSSAIHLLTLINEILDLSKIEAGKMELFTEDIHLPSLVNEIANTALPTIQKNGNKLSIHLPEYIPNIRSDATKLKQILLNLLSNAGKFTQSGEIIFSIDEEKINGTGWIGFRVKDNGIGMTEEQVTKVFDAFTQADNSTTRRYGGTGLGLTVTKKLCEMMGGYISVNSTPSENTVFTVMLPVDISY